ncbi:MAG: polyphenol oxidase family protein [Ghiorsea sp.]
MSIADSHAKVIAAVHAGWKGTVSQVAQKAVKEMCALGAQPERIVASFGPFIGSCCFEVNEDVEAQLNVSCGQNFSRKENDKIYISLAQINESQLLSVGVIEPNVEVSGVCTACSSNPHYFSYRRDEGQTGRQLSLIMLP